jgi:hypothetical protein
LNRVYDGASLRVQGMDDEGRIWVILDGETAIAAYTSSGGWSVYGADQGWTTPPPHEYHSPGYGDGLVTDLQGKVWLATGRNDLRQFDPQTDTWRSLTATDIGYDPPEEEGYQGHFLSDVALSENGMVWVGDCIGMGETIKGQGIRWFDGENWFETPYTEGECVQDMEMAPDGRMWVSGFDALHFYDPSTSSWSSIPLPPWERRQLVVDLSLGSDDSPWVEIMRYGGASAYGAVARVHLEGEEWVLDFDLEFSNLAFSGDGGAWLCSYGAIYKIEGGQAEEMENIAGMECLIAVDGANRLWVAGQSELWWMALGD